MTHRIAAAVTVSLLLTSCSIFSRSKSQFYSLDRIPPERPMASVRGLPIGIDSLELPPGSDRRDIVVRQPDHRLEVRGSQQWSASLQPMVLHTLAFDLASRLPEGMLVLPGEPKPAAMRSIDIAVEELSAGPANAVTLDARWTLRQNRGASTHHEVIRIDLPSLDSDNIATGMSRAVATLADRIAAQLPE